MMGLVDILNTMLFPHAIIFLNTKCGFNYLNAKCCPRYRNYGNCRDGMGARDQRARYDQTQLSFLQCNTGHNLIMKPNNHIVLE